MTNDSRKLLIASMPATIAAVGSLLVSLISGFATRSKIATANEKIEVVRVDVNDKMKKFLELTSKAAYAEGVKSETDKDGEQDSKTKPLKKE